MADQTLVAVYETAADAAAAVQDLHAAHVPADAISQHAQSGGAGTSDSSHIADVARGQTQGFWAKLIGSDPGPDTTAYDRSVASGGTVVSVRVPADKYESVSALLERHNPIDLDDHEGAATTQTTSTTTAATQPMPAPVAHPTATPDGGKLQLSEETLSVGKRAVSGGTTRIRRYVVETPVQEQITLHSEKVTLDRHPVTDGRAVSAGDFTEKTIEMTETNEEAVVSKVAHVREEVSLRKDASDRVETVKDTVRREDVEIEHVKDGQTTTGHVPAAAAAIPPNPAQRGSKI